MKIKMRCTVMNKVNGLPGPFVVGVEYEMSDANANAFVTSGLAEYVDAPVVADTPAAVYEVAVLTDTDVIETPEDAVPRAFMRQHRRDR